jgi:hypothetical protein
LTEKGELMKIFVNEETGKRYRVNDHLGIVFDRHESERRRGTNIVMIHIRQRKEGEKSAYTKEVAPGWIVDFDANDKPIEIEVLDSSVFPQAILDLLPPEFEDIET